VTHGMSVRVSQEIARCLIGYNDVVRLSISMTFVIQNVETWLSIVRTLVLSD